MAGNLKINTSALGVSWKLNETYHVAVDEGVVFQTTGLKLPNSANANITYFSTPANLPAISSLWPVDNGTGILNNDKISFTIDRPTITANTGNVNLYSSANVLLHSWTIASLDVTGNTVTIPINHLCQASSSYYVNTSANIVQDADNWKFPGITTNNTWNWTTSASWQPDLAFVANTHQYYEDTPYVITTCTVVDDLYNKISYETGTYEMNVTVSSGNVRAISADGTGLGGTFNQVGSTSVITGNAKQVNDRLSTFTLTPADDFVGNIVLNYQLTNPNSNVYTHTQLLTVYENTAETLNLVDRTFAYTANTSQYINQINSLAIGDIGVTSADTYEVTLDILDPICTFSTPNVTANSSVTITGNRSYVNNELYYLNLNTPANFIGNLSFTYTQVRNGNTQVTGTTLNLTQTGAPADVTSGGTYKTSTATNDVYYIRSNDTAYIPSKKYFKYYVIGGGGGGGSTSYNAFSDINAGGGGAGGVVLGNLRTSGVYSFVIGTGGTSGTSGSNSSAFGFTAIGGGAGGSYNGSNNSWTAPSIGGSGGGGAHPNVGASGTSLQGNAGGFGSGNGGGGGGYGSAGQSGSGGGGAGGSGILINGNYYAAGGGGGWIVSGGAGGSGVGGHGGGSGENGQNAIAYTGSGGGGAGQDVQVPGYVGAGGSGSNGVIILDIPTTAALPGAPTITNIYKTGNAATPTATISYTAPAHTGSSAITSYTAISNLGNVGSVATSGSGNLTISGLALGETHNFHVYAENSYGQGPDSNTSANIVLYYPPLAPTIGSGFVLSNVSANVSFTAPSNNGGNVITSYTAISTPESKTGTINQSGSGNITINNLSPGVTYTFKVYATNAYGDSDYSASTGNITLPRQPDAPTVKYGYKTGSTTANVVYTAPAYDGGSAITSYTAVTSPGGITATVSTAGSGEIQLTGLNSSTTYDIIVYATNQYGNSSNSSASAKVYMSSTDPYMGQVQLLLRGGQPLLSTTIVDDSKNALSTSSNNGVDYSILVSKWTTSSLHFNGSSYCSYATNSLLAIPEDFTWEAWVYHTASGSNGLLGYTGSYPALGLRSDASATPEHGLYASMSKAGSAWDVNGWGFYRSETTLNTWKHVAITRKDNKIHLFIGGNILSVGGLDYETLTGLITQNTSLDIGRAVLYALGSTFFTGYMEDIRFTQGVARYTANFTPPSARFPAAP